MKTVVNGKGQIVIPAELRRKYGIQPGTRIIMTDNGEAIILKPVNEEWIKRFQGKFKGKSMLKSLLEERRKETND